MKAKDKLVVNWSKEERTAMFHYPLGNQTKCAAGYLSGILTDEVLSKLEDYYGYDKTTFRFSIEPKKGNKDFASQREGNEDEPSS